MDQATAKKILQELIKREDLKNKTCVDCGNPNPQWASLSFAVFLCLQCAGLHRGFGVHVSFVRSVSMDTWQEEQVKRMQSGGNAPFRSFMQSYTPVEQGGYQDGMNSYDTYHSWAAAQYKEKLSADLEGKPWSPSPPTSDFSSPKSGSDYPGRPSSAQGLRKSRTSARSATGSSLRAGSASPASFTDSPSIGAISSSPSSPTSQKTANEAYFASLGSVNATRSADLPPSQGGRYQGFGNTPSPAVSTQHPSFGLSSAAAPSFSDFQDNPSAALSKGWSLFSAAVAGATRVVSESVIQPGLERVRDPNFQQSVKSVVEQAGKRVGAASSVANDWTRSQIGVDVKEQVGGLFDTVRDRVVGPGYEGYGALATSHDEEHRYYDDDEFFDKFSDEKPSSLSAGYGSPSNTATSSTAAATTSKAATKVDDWDEWKDF